MAECFCGCGEEIGLFDGARKHPNKVGPEVSRLLDDLRPIPE
ncbi:MAG: hypothetical protein QM648_05850 [Solirubrobacterales bacterium]